MGKYRVRKKRSAPLKPQGTKPGYSELQKMYYAASSREMYIYYVLKGLMMPGQTITTPEHVAKALEKDRPVDFDEIVRDVIELIPREQRRDLVHDLHSLVCMECGEIMRPSAVSHTCVDGDPYDDFTLAEMGLENEDVP